MSQLPQLITNEEVYDLDTFQLQEWRDLLVATKTDDQSWNKKAKKLLDLIQLEITERNAIENFAFNLKFDFQQQQPLFQNDALLAILNDIKNRPANYLEFEDPSLQKKQEQPKQEPLPPQKPPKPSSSQQSDTLSVSTTSTHNRSINSKPKKSNNIQDFMKSVLEKTNVDNQKFVIGAAVQGRYIPPPPKPQLSTVERIKQEKLLKKKKKKAAQRSESQNATHLPQIKPNKQLIEDNSDKTEPISQPPRKETDRALQKPNTSAGISQKASTPAIQLAQAPHENTQNYSQPSRTSEKQMAPDLLVDEKKLLAKTQTEEGGEQAQAQVQAAYIIPEKTFVIHQGTLESSQLKKSRLTESEPVKNQISNQSSILNRNTEQSFQEKAGSMGSNRFNVSANEANGPIQQSTSVVMNPNLTNEIAPAHLAKQSQVILNNDSEQSYGEDDQYESNSANHYQELAAAGASSKMVENGKADAVFQITKAIQEPSKTGQWGQKTESDLATSSEVTRDNKEATNEQQRSLDSRTDGRKQSQELIANSGHQHRRSEESKTPQIKEKQCLPPSKNGGNQKASSNPNNAQHQNCNQKIGRLPTNQSKQEEIEIIKEEINEGPTEREEPQKYQLQKQLVGRILPKSNGPVKPIEVVHKPVKTNQEKMEEIQQLCKEMELDEFIKTSDKNPQKPSTAALSSKSQTASRPTRSNQKNQSKYITKMMQCLDDSKLEDYNDIIPTFQHLFSGFYNNSPNYNHLDQMREIYEIFQQHIERVDNVDSLLNKYKINPIGINPAELAFVNDPRKLIAYATKTGIDITQFIQRQMIFNQRLKGDEQKADQYFRVIKTKEEVYGTLIQQDIITRSFMRKLNWSELPHGIALRTSWNVLWTWAKPQINLNKLIYFQKVNHFSFNKNLARKDLLKKNIERCQKLGAKTYAAFDFIPPTFLLPKEYVQFMEKFYKDSETEGAYNIWIMKPTSKSRGRGIQVLNDISDVMYAEPVVLQKYLKNPLLLRGHKFDMRIYVLVTQFNPLEIFLYKEGFARLTTQPFTLDISELKNQLIHLTNYAVQKSHIQISDLDQQLGGSKISLRQLKEKLHEKGVDWNKIWDQVQDIVLKSLVASQSEIPHNPNSFELFGYDIIIDTNQKCWLLEVNSSPSLARDYILDELIKQQLIDEIFDLLEPVNYDRQRLCEVLERRIQEEQGNKSAINTMNNSKLQCQRDLNYILHGQHIRRYGEMPKKMGSFMRLAPSEKYEKLRQMVASYKTVNGRGTID